MWLGRNAGGTTDNTAKQSRQAGQFNIPKKGAGGINPSLDYQENWYGCSDMEKKKGAM